MTDRDDAAALRERIARAIMGELYADAPLSRPVLQQSDDVLAVIIAAGWRAPDREHEHRWVVVRDIVTGADICATCGAWKDQ